MDKIIFEYLDEAIYGLYDEVAEGKMTTQEALEEFLSFPLKGLETITPNDKQLLYRRMKTLFRKIEKEQEDWDLYENKKVKISESKLKSIIKESIDKILKEDVWGNPQSQERQLGDEYLRMTMDFCKNNGINLNGSTISTQLVPKLREVISIMLNAK